MGAIAGCKDDSLFRQGMELLWSWVMLATYVCLFTDGEARYAKYFWQLAPKKYFPHQVAEPRLGQGSELCAGDS